MDSTIQLAEAIPPVSPREAIALERRELERFIQAIRELPEDAWARPVGRCPWDVRALVAHVAGGYAAQAHFAEFRRQVDPRVIRLYRMPGDSLPETVARVQVGDRSRHSPDELIEELRAAGPPAIDHRATLFLPLQVISRALGSNRALPEVPLGPFQAVRDLWYHRLDIADAAGTGMVLDHDHDGRILALMMRASVGGTANALGERSVDLVVTLAPGNRWRFGAAAEPAAVIELDPVVLARLLARGRSPAGTRERSQIKGDVKTAMALLTALHRGR